MIKALIELVVTAGMAFFKEWRARQDVKENVRYEMALNATKNAIEALRWKARAAATGTGTDLGVRPGSSGIDISDEGPSPP